MKVYEHIPGFRYLIFRDGRVYSLITGRFLKPGINKISGYYQVSLCKSGKSYCKLISRLIAETFIPNPDNKPQTNHKDGNKLNNDISNLEWVTASENGLHAYATGLSKCSPNAGKPKVPVNVYDYKTKIFLSTHPYMLDAAKEYGVPVENIWRILVGRCKQAKGLTFTKA